jgi:hypothetical protein
MAAKKTKFGLSPFVTPISRVLAIALVTPVFGELFGKVLERFFREFSRRQPSRKEGVTRVTRKNAENARNRGDKG